METSRSQSRSRSALRAAASSLVAFVALSAFLAGCGAKPETSTPAPSTPVADTPAPADPTPVAAADPAADAKQQFATKCATCHGPDGHGNGPASAALNPKPRNFHDKSQMAGLTDADLVHSITMGKGAMPKWGGVLTESQITALVAHIRELGKTP